MSERVEGLGLSVQELSDAWIYLFGRYLVIRQEHLDLAEDGVDYNVLKHNPPVLAGVAAGAAPSFVNPNLDVVYSEAWIAVDPDTPALLTVPDVPASTYYTAQIVDEWAEITCNVNDRTFPQQPHGTYALCLAGSDPEIPAGALRIDLPSGKAKLLARVQIGADLDAAVRLQHGFGLRSTGSPRIEPAVELPPFSNREPLGAAFFERPRLEQALAAPDRSGQADRFAPIVARIADFVAAGAENAAVVDELVRTHAFPAFMQLLTHMSAVGNGWTSAGNRSGFGEDWRFRTVANFGGIWWNSATEVIYYLLQVDDSGSAPTGDHAYEIGFPAGESPGEHVNGYWSITLYSHPDVRLVPNPIGRYSISYRDQLEPDSGGGFTIHIAAGPPAGAPQPNWLPSTGPGRPWALVMRLYLPRSEILDGAWSPPALRTVGAR